MMGVRVRSRLEEYFLEISFHRERLVFQRVDLPFRKNLKSQGGGGLKRREKTPGSKSQVAFCTPGPEILKQGGEPRSEEERRKHPSKKREPTAHHQPVNQNQRTQRSQEERQKRKRWVNARKPRARRRPPLEPPLPVDSRTDRAEPQPRQHPGWWWLVVPPPRCGGRDPRAGSRRPATAVVSVGRSTPARALDARRRRRPRPTTASISGLLEN